MLDWITADHLQGIVAGWVSLFFGLYAIAVASRNRVVSSVTIYDENGRKTVKRASRKKRKVRTRGNRKTEANDVIGAGENVHAVLRSRK